MRNAIAPVKNVRALSDAADHLTTRAAGVPGMALVWGPTGWGKTTAAAWLRNRVDGVFIRALGVWTPSSMLEAIARELGGTWRGSCARTLDWICERLEQRPRPLMVDEADYVLRRSAMVDSLRDLHDFSGVPVIMIGMPGIQRQLVRWPQVTGRILHEVEFRPCDLEDAHVLANALCEVRPDGALLARLEAEARGSVRLIVVGLARIEAFARARGLDPVTPEAWGKRPFFFGEPPAQPNGEKG